MVKGKIVVCVTEPVNRMEQGEEAASAGAAGMILCNDRISGDEFLPPLPFLDVCLACVEND